MTVSIRAPRQLVWDTMLDEAGYRVWTAPFCDGSYYEGSWQVGQTIRFLSPDGDGMLAEIAEHQPGEFVSIRHVGEVRAGVDDTTSDRVRSWAPAHESYSFADVADGTEVTVNLETTAAYETYMRNTYPKALLSLKNLCERKAATR